MRKRSTTAVKLLRPFITLSQGLKVSSSNMSNKRTAEGLAGDKDGGKSMRKEEIEEVDEADDDGA